MSVRAYQTLQMKISIGIKKNEFVVIWACTNPVFLSSLKSQVKKEQIYL